MPRLPRESALGWQAVLAFEAEHGEDPDQSGDADQRNFWRNQDQAPQSACDKISSLYEARLAP